jgi:hypothetical protein
MSKLNKTQGIVSIALTIAALTAGGCASIVHGGNRSLSINSQPAGAKATITKASGEAVVVQTTPCTVSLDPKGGYFRGQSYTLKLELDGYQSTEVQLRPALSGWYFGNIIFGGLIGMIAVDPVTGSMWNIEPAKIEQTLTASQATLIKEKQGFVVVLASQLTPGERQSMTKIN